MASWSSDLTTACPHAATAPERDVPANLACAECLTEGTRWVALRMCLECGHVGCCDSSPGRHATAHYEQTHHPVMQSVMPGDRWGWCYVDSATLTRP